MTGKKGITLAALWAALALLVFIYTDRNEMALCR